MYPLQFFSILFAVATRILLDEANDGLWSTYILLSNFHVFFFSDLLDVQKKQDFYKRIKILAITSIEIETLIRTAFPNAKITITDLAGDGNHYAAEIIDESFRGQNRITQQRSVYAALRGKMDGPNGELHALRLITKSPSETV